MACFYFFSAVKNLFARVKKKKKKYVSDDMARCDNWQGLRTRLYFRSVCLKRIFSHLSETLNE